MLTFDGEGYFLYQKNDIYILKVVYMFTVNLKTRCANMIQMPLHCLYKFSDLSEEEKWLIAYNTLVDYIDDILANPLGEEHNKPFKTNKIFKRLLYILNSINIFNKTIRHIDWKQSQRYVTATFKIVKI